MDIKYYNTQEVAELLKCSKQTILKAYKTGLLQGSSIQRHLLFTPEQVEEYVRKGVKEPEKPKKRKNALTLEPNN